MLSVTASLEAVLFASGEPVSKQQLRKLLHLEEGDLASAISTLAQELKGRGLAIVETDTEAEIRTAPEAAELVKELRASELSRDLGKASLETLAVIAYKAGESTNDTGATRSEIDWVRGVNSSASVRTLLVRGLIDGVEDEKDKRKIRYKLTTEALAHLGLSSAESLPRYRELQASAAALGTEDGVVDKAV